MSLKIKFDRLEYQDRAVKSISSVFKNIAFVPNENRKSNPNFDLSSHRGILAQNISDDKFTLELESAVGSLGIKGDKLRFRG